MGQVICKHHGSGFLFVCPEIRNAIHEKLKVSEMRCLEFSAPDDQDLAELKLTGWFCVECIETYQLDLDQVVGDVDQFLHKTNEIMKPACPGCFEDWKNGNM